MADCLATEHTVVAPDLIGHGDSAVRAGTTRWAPTRGDPWEPLQDVPEAAHFPNLEDPEGLAAALREFIAATDPAASEATEDWGAVLSSHSTPRRREPTPA